MLGYGQEALIGPGRCGCFAPLLGLLCPSPAGTGGDRAIGAHPLTKVSLASTDRSRKRAPTSAKKARRDCNRVPADGRRRGMCRSPFGGRRIGYRRAPFDALRSCGCRDKQDAAPVSRQLPRASRGLPVYRMSPRSQSAAPYAVDRLPRSATPHTVGR